MVTEFTKCLGWSSVELIFSQFQERLQFGIQRELCDLMRLPMLNAMRARVLFSAGFTDIASIATANITDLENAFFAMVPFQSKKEIAGETSYDKDKRNKLEAIWITGKADLSIHEAAELLLTEARNILEIEIDFERAKWSKKDSSLSDSIQNRSVTHKICNTSIVQKNRNSSAAKNDSINKSNVMASQDKTENENLKKKGNSIIKANNVLVPYEFSDKKFINECNKECQEKEETLNSSQNLCNSKMKIVNEFDKEKLIASMNTSLEMPKAKVTSVEINEKKQVRASPNFSASKPEEFNFTSSFIFDMIPDYITEGRDDETVQNCSAGNIDNPSLISIKHRYSDPDSIDSVEVLYDTNIDENSKILSFSKLSEDMFDKENSSGKKMSTPIPVQNYARSAECKMSKNCLAEISSPDLFSQSLTFDTQLGRILDFEEPPPKEFQPIVNPSTSFNSDDLGFVSDLSPPKSNRKQMQNLKNPKILEDKKIKENFEVQNKSFSPLYPKKLADNLIEKEEEMPEAIKRKIDSPDLIVDSDESSMENQPAKKRVKCSFSASKNLRSEFIAPLVVNDSDDEVMPTPKPEEVRILNVSSRNLNRTLRSFDRSFTKRGSQSKVFQKTINFKKVKSL